MPDFRARRPASPPVPTSEFIPPPASSQRFPRKGHGYLDADERRATATAGPLRKPHTPTAALRITPSEWKLLVGICLLAAGVRLFRLSWPNSVVFDEVHFGKFAGKYIKTQFHVDVHPPLAKMLIALAAFVSGFDGAFDFKDIAKVYENTPYVAMRLFPAVMGVAVVPLTYLTLRGLDCSTVTALLGSLFITFENGLITQSRHILLDSPLIFFTSLSTFFWVGFSNEDKAEPFTQSWWTWLTLTGLSLGAVASCKWVGLFTIATVGLCTIRQLWVLLGDVRVTPRLWMKHFLARAICLIAVPVFFYMAMFQIHFAILHSSGDGDGFMSSEFQHTLEGRSMDDTYADVALGSEIAIRHLNTQGGYLHSHPHNYPGGSQQQHITLYPHRDHNNNWRIVNVTAEGERDFDWANNDPVYVSNGMIVRLEHIATTKRLHSHDFRPPVSDVDFQNEVSGYGFEGFTGDANDNWVVEIDYGDNRDIESYKRLRTLKSKFRLRHQLSGCYLFSHKVKLPDWGFEQQEVTCNKNAVKPNSLWYVETNLHTRLPHNAEMVNYQLPGFLSKFLELQQVMWTTNKGLTDRHAYDSRPGSWPTLRRGINFWVKDHRQIYLIGNPFVWWLSTASVAAYSVARGFLILRAKRGYKDFNNTVVVKYDGLCGFLALGWFLHYFPFFLMSRQLFLHHYFPALYYAILLSCAVFDLATLALRPRVRLQIAGALIILAIWNYQHFSPLAYGGVWTKAKCNSSKWVKTWDFSCNDFLDNTSQYATVAIGAPGRTTATSPPKVTIGGHGEGRAPVVVEDVHHKAAGDAHGDSSESTKSVLNPIEPGPNVFDKPKEEVTTHVPDAPQEKHQETQPGRVVPNPDSQNVAQEGQKPKAPVEAAAQPKPAPPPAGDKPGANQPDGPPKPAAPIEAIPPANSPAGPVQNTNPPKQEAPKKDPPKEEKELSPEEKMEDKLRHELFPDAA